MIETFCGFQMRILVIEDGNIIESGSHAELINNGEHYAQLHRLQLGG